MMLLNNKGCCANELWASGSVVWVVCWRLFSFGVVEVGGKHQERDDDQGMLRGLMSAEGTGNGRYRG